MVRLEDLIINHIVGALRELYGALFSPDKVPVQRTRKDLSGDFTIVVFPFLKASRKSPADTAEDLGNYLTSHIDEISGFEVIKGFLNLHVKNSYWLRFFSSVAGEEKYGHILKGPESAKFVIEYSSPNTNKPLHLGHIRNNLLGYSVSKLAEAGGMDVVMVNLVNDRGIHICKSMVAWQKWGNGATPESEGIKGDKFVGNF
jgi:arginyl-tRNA synthetase